MNICTVCNYCTPIKQNYEKHLLTKKHKDNENNIKLMKENKMFSCNTCKYHTKYIQNYNKHIQGKRHLEKEAGRLIEFKCSVCGKPYGSFNNMKIHESKCANNTITQTNVKNALQLIPQLQLQSSTQLQPIIHIDNLYTTVNNNTVNNNNNSVNTVNNIQNFLNQKCANTPNLIDYVKSFDIKNEHMHEIHYKRSFVMGMTIVLLKNFDKIKKENWPIFCVDEQTYVRDKNEWKLHDIDKIKEFIFAFYKIVNEKYIQNNIKNDEYHTRFIYKEIKEKMKNYIKDDDACTAIAEDIIKYFSMEKEEFSKIFGEDDEEEFDISLLKNAFEPTL